MNPILRQVILIVADEFGEKPGDLNSETRFFEDLSASLDFEETIMACEEAFGIAIPDEEAYKLITIGLLAAYIEKRLPPDKTVWPPAPKMPESYGGNL